MKPNLVDAYIAKQPAELRPMLKEIRSLLQSIVPAGTEETISYQIPSYKYNGMLVGFGVRKDGCSFYTMNATLLDTIPGDLKNFQHTPSAIHLDPAKKIPVSLIKKITKMRIKENEERAAMKKMIK